MVAKFCKTIIKDTKSNKNGQKQKNIKNHLPIINYIIIFAQKNTHIGMNTTDQTTQQIERTIKKIAQKFHNSEDTSALTDIHLRVSQDSGELLAFDDETGEILYTFQVGSGIVGSPVTWEQNGEQFISIVSGWGGAVPLWGGEVAKQIKNINQGGTVHVFKLHKSK